MEPMVIFSAGLVVFCGYIALVDAVNDWHGGRVAAKKENGGKRQIRTVRRRLTFSAQRRAGGGGRHWPRPLTGSV
jgi:hypothetical protein